MIITQPKELIGAFVNMKQGLPPSLSWGAFTAIGLVRDGHLVCGLVYNGSEVANVNLHIGAVEGSRWMTRELLFAAFDYPFNQLGKRRITACVRGKNKRAERFVKKMGFVYEGTMADYFKDDDLLFYGMLKEDCRFISKPQIRKAGAV